MANWNHKHIALPAVSSTVYTVESICKDKLLDAHGSLHMTVEALTQPVFASEVFTLSRLIYKCRNQQRNWKGFSRLKQLSKCLKICTEMGLSTCLRQLMEMMPTRLSLSDEAVYLPSTVLVEHALLRLLGASSVLQKCAGFSVSAYHLITHKLAQGVFVKQMIILAAAVSRIWMISHLLVDKVCQCYSKLKLWLDTLRPSAVSLVTAREPLPSDITIWLQSFPDTQQVVAPSFLRLEQRAELDTLMSTQSLVPGEIVDRDWFSKHASMDRSCNESAASHEAFIGSTVPTKSPLIDRVATFLGNASETPAVTATSIKTVRPRLTESELNSCRQSVLDCSHISQLYVVVKKISKSQPGAHFRGMERCLANLKALKAARNAGKSCGRRDQDNMELLQRGITFVEEFLNANQDSSVKAADKSSVKRTLENCHKHSTRNIEEISADTDTEVTEKRRRQKLLAKGRRTARNIHPSAS